MAGRAENSQFVRNPWLHFKIGVAAIAFDQPEVEVVTRDLLHNSSSVVDLQLHLALRVPLQELSDDKRSQVVTDGQRGTDAERAESGTAFEQVFDLFARDSKYVLKRRESAIEQVTAIA